MQFSVFFCDELAARSSINNSFQLIKGPISLGLLPPISLLYLCHMDSRCSSPDLGPWWRLLPAVKISLTSQFLCGESHLIFFYERFNCKWFLGQFFPPFHRHANWHNKLHVPHGIPPQWTVTTQDNEDINSDWKWKKKIIHFIMSILMYIGYSGLHYHLVLWNVNCVFAWRHCYQMANWQIW